jgi:hypothetical protein
MRLIGIVLAAATLALAGGCATTQPINNVVNAPFTLPADKPLTMTQISRAIVVAGNQLGWQMQPVGPGKITGRLARRTHVADVDIEHDTKSYSIKYRDSQNLDAKDGMIHKNYNGWIENLDKAIRTQVQNAGG